MKIVAIIHYLFSQRKMAQLRQADTARSHLPEFPEDLDDVIVAGLSKGQQVRLYEYLRNEILPRH